MSKEYPKTETILRLLAAGVILTSLFLMPHATIGLMGTFHHWAKFKQNHLRKTIDRLRKRRLVRYVKKDNETIIELTDLGKNEILRFDLSKITIKKLHKWDKKWWLVVFDIPEKYRKNRILFRKKLKELDFYFIQKSVCLCPYPCKKEIEFIREVYRIKEGVNIIRVDYFENEFAAKEYFSLTE
jgi:DNA-binding transcriptional regulator PaaX